jgi:hypothetical protein
VKIYVIVLVGRFPNPNCGAWARIALIPHFDRKYIGRPPIASLEFCIDSSRRTLDRMVSNRWIWIAINPIEFFVGGLF